MLLLVIDMPAKKMKEDEIQVRVVFEGEEAAKFNAIKKKYGLKSNADVIRFLIAREYERIQKGLG